VVGSCTRELGRLRDPDPERPRPGTSRGRRVESGRWRLRLGEVRGRPCPSGPQARKCPSARRLVARRAESIRSGPGRGAGREEALAASAAVATISVTSPSSPKPRAFSPASPPCGRNAQSGRRCRCMNSTTGTMGSVSSIPSSGSSPHTRSTSAPASYCGPPGRLPGDLARSLNNLGGDLSSLGSRRKGVVRVFLAR